MPAKSKKPARKKPVKKRAKRKKSTTSSPPREVKLITLTEVAKNVNISLPSAQRYKKLYQERIPSVGEGRKQRYPEEAVEVFAQIKVENLKRRGRPRKHPEAGAPKKAKKARKARARTKASAAGLITLTEISQRTGISYPTCVSYVKKYGDRIPHVGEGRKRRFPEEAVPVFQEIRGQSRRGRKPKSAAVHSRPKAGAGKSAKAGVDKAVAARIRALEKAQAENTRLLKSIVKLLERPLEVIVGRR